MAVNCFSNLQPCMRRAEPYPGAVRAKRLTDVDVYDEGLPINVNIVPLRILI